MNGSSNASHEGSRSAVGNVGEEWFLEFPCGYGQVGCEKALKELTLNRILRETARVYEEMLTRV